MPPSRSVLTVPADARRDNEDALAYADGVAVVVDGAGLPKRWRLGCHHAVSWYSTRLAERFLAHLIERNGSMIDALERAIAEVAASHGAQCDLTAGSPSATVAAWRVDGEDIEHLVLCDASIVLVGKDGAATEITDDRIDEAVRRRSAELAAEEGIAAEEVAFAALDEMRNVEGGFWCAHVDPRAARHALTGRVRRADLVAIVAASDGATRGYQKLGAHTLEEFAALVVEDDLARIADEVRAAERAAGPGHAAKQYDDLTLAVWRS